MAYAPHLAALIGRKFTGSKELKSLAEVDSDGLFAIAVMGASAPIHGIPISVKGRIEWAHTHAKAHGHRIDSSELESLELGARSFQSEAFKVFVEALMEE